MSARRQGLISLCIMLALSLAACVPQHAPKAAAGLTRAEPAYVQWLTRQSMLGMAPHYSGMVSATDMLLRAPSVDAASHDMPPTAAQASGTQGGARGDRIDTLLTAADAWLWVHPPTLLTANMRPVWLELAASASAIEGLGVRGVYVAPTGESGGLWGYDRKASSTGDDITSLTFAAHMGDDAQFDAFTALAVGKSWQLGGDILTPATGMGPDFILAAQMVRDYPGAYLMLEAPENLWPQLPAVSQPWEGAALEPSHLALLYAKGLLPPGLARDSLTALPAGGWAATGEVRGNDGRLRRWIYRYDRDPRHPLLQWDDPAGAARRMTSASVIRHVGVLQHTLAGVRVAPLLGLDATTGGPQPQPTLEPAPSALRDITREIRRYGGWSALLDALPLPLLAALRDGGADFMADGVTAPAAELALLWEDAEALRAALRASLAANIPQRRLLRRLSSVEGLDLRLLPDATRQIALDKLREQTAGPWQGLLDVDGLRLFATAPTLAALSARLTPVSAASPDHAADIRRRHLLLTLFRAGLPGILFISGQDMTGALSLSEGPAAQRAQGAWGLQTSAAAMFATRQGVPRAQTVYAPLPEQLQTPGSYAATVRDALRIRQKYGLGRGILRAVADTQHPGSVALFLSLPDNAGGGTLLLAANFSSTPVTERLTLPAGVHGEVRDILQTQDARSVSGSIAVRLEGLTCRWLRIGGK